MSDECRTGNQSVPGASKRIKNPRIQISNWRSFYRCMHRSHRRPWQPITALIRSDSLSSSSSSDDDFLTIKNGKGARNEDREALVRKKLLESFYGASAVQQQEEAEASAKPSALQRKQETELNASHDEDDEEEDEEQRKQRSSKDLDSPYFAHEAFIRDQVIGSSVHDLLETEERLALQVRTLDSTMAAPTISGPDQIVLIDFVTEALSSFLAHVRTVLLGEHALHTETSPGAEVARYKPAVKTARELTSHQIFSRLVEQPMRQRAVLIKTT